MKHLSDFMVVGVETPVSPRYALIKLQPVDNPYSLTDMISPGQFVNVAVNQISNRMLRRPISVCDIEDGCLYLMVRNAGEATSRLIESRSGDRLNLLWPLGNGFSLPEGSQKPLLVGGGVGVAPLLYWARQLKAKGITPTVIVAARTATDLLLVDRLSELAETKIATDDGSVGFHGFAAAHPYLLKGNYDSVQCCGPLPMMKAVAKVVSERGIDCQVSLENTMGCGLGACLCCVEETNDQGNVCVCTEGPVFNINQLKWQ